MRPFPGWIIRREGDEIVVMAPEANPGMMFVHPKRGRLADRLLFALADAVLRSDEGDAGLAPQVPSEGCPPASGGSLPSLGILDERPAAPEGATHWRMIHPTHAVLNKTIDNAALACRLIADGYACEPVAP